MNIQNEINCHQEMLNLRNSNQDPPDDLYYSEGSDEEDMEIDSLTKEPSDTLLMGDEVICTTLARENDEFIKSSVDDLFPIPRESEVTSDSNLKCDMPTPLPTTDVRKEYFDIKSPLGEQVVDFLMENEDVAGLPRHLVKRLFSHLVKNLSSTKRMFDEPLGDNSKPRSYDFEDISSLDPPESTPVIDESTLLVTPPPASKQFSLRKIDVYRYSTVLDTTSGDGFDPEIKKIPSDESKAEEFEELNVTVCMVAQNQQVGSDSENGTIYDFDFINEEVSDGQVEQVENAHDQRDAEIELLVKNVQKETENQGTIGQEVKQRNALLTKELEKYKKSVRDIENKNADKTDFHKEYTEATN
ncbi:hypothetical protein Tco_0492357 [Tanacetum coccineum]